MFYFISIDVEHNGGVIDVHQLRALVELSRLGTVSAVAESLGYSQSTVSHQLAALSRATGAVLLTRAGRGVRLTEEGRALADRGREVLDLLERTEREAIAMAHAETGRIRLAAFPSAVAALVPGVLDVVSQQYPVWRSNWSTPNRPRRWTPCDAGGSMRPCPSPTSTTTPAPGSRRFASSTTSSTS